MLAYTAIPLTCWVCALLALPHRPRAGDEVQELVYRRLTGRHHLLLACAIVTSLGVMLALLLTTLSASLSGAR